MGDIHGAHKALVQVLERSGFDREADTLIFLGDVADGYVDVKQCIDELLTIKNLIHVKGNHDQWMEDWIDGDGSIHWVNQGGRATLRSYGQDQPLRPTGNVPEAHVEYLRTARYYYIDDENRLFVHGGFKGEHPLGCSNETLMWDRDLFVNAVARPYARHTKFNEVFVGHTATRFLGGGTLPMHCGEIWNLDTDCGWGGPLTIMDVDTKEFWQSDRADELYGHSGR
jgi:serine/threonine protein phosphatase 1